MKLQEVSGILFDLDGTLTDYDAGCEAGLRAALNVMNEDRERPLPWDVFETAYFSVIESEAHWSGTKGFHLPAQENRVRRFRILFDALGIQTGPVLQSMADAYGAGRINGTTLLPGVKEGLNYFMDKYRLGVITEGSVETQESQLLTHKIHGYFDPIIISGATPWHKPSVSLYKFAASKFECGPEHIVMVGDRLDWDIKPAKEVGMQTIFLNHDPENEDKEQIEMFADRVVFDFNELRTML